MVNLGDLFSRWTNNRYFSNLHRVLNHNTSFGCPFACNFCAVVALANRRWLRSWKIAAARPAGPCAICSETEATGAVLAGRRTVEQVDHWQHRSPCRAAFNYYL